MDHVAIMRKSWGLTEKILRGEKRIESRWYKSRYAPWDRIKQGETIYFKNSGEQVNIKAKVSKVSQFSNLTPVKIKNLLIKYGKADGLPREDLDRYYQLFKEKKYCLLVFLKNPTKIEPFNIDKTGYGAMAAWITVEDVNKIKAR